MSRSYRTSKGSDLPLLNLKGKEYMQVAHRIVWFREEKENWSIETEFLHIGPEHAVARATIKNEQGRIMSQATKCETQKGFPDFIEKAETGAVGRALAFVGHGTQFCAEELSEGSRLADSPIELTTLDEPKKQNAPQIQSSDPGEYVVTFGKKYKGMKLKDMKPMEIEGYLDWLEDSAKQKGVPLSEECRFFKVAAERYLLALDKAPL